MPAWLAAALSVAVHAAAVALFAARTGDHAHHPDRTPTEPPKTLNRVALGDNLPPTLSLAWIGFDDPTPHDAPESQTLQPLLRRATPPAATAAAAPTTPPQDPRPDPSRPTIQAAQLAASDAAETLRAAARALARALAPLLPKTDTDAQTPQTAAAHPNKADPTDPQPHTQTPPLTDTGPSPAQAPARAERPPTNARDDRDADPADPTPVSQQQLGQPLTTQGIRITTVRPSFGLVTRATARPSNPTVLIEFDASGAVTAAEILVSSGNQSVDRPLLDALYRWRAQGERIDQLPPTQTVAIRLTILL